MWFVLKLKTKKINNNSWFDWNVVFLKIMLFTIKIYIENRTEVNIFLQSVFLITPHNIITFITKMVVYCK